MLCKTKARSAALSVGILLALAAPVAVQAAAPVVIEAEKCWQPPGDPAWPNYKVVDEAGASGGKVMAVPEGLEGLVLVCPLLQNPKPGRYHGSVRFRVDKLEPIGRCFSVRVLELPEAPNAEHRLLSVVNAYGWRFPGYSGAWAELPFECEVIDFPKSLDLNVNRNDSPIHWWTPQGTDPSSGTPPAGAIDCITFYPEPEPLPPVRVVKVWPDKIRYSPGAQATVTITLQNTTEQPQSGELRCSAVGELTETEAIGSKPVNLRARERVEVVFPWKPGKLQYGLEVRGEVYAGGKAVNANHEFCQVHVDAQRVAVEGGMDWAYRHDMAQFLTVMPLTSKHAAHLVECMRQDYCNKSEASSLYAPGGGFDQYSTAGAWVSGQGGGWAGRGFRESILACGREMAKQGILWTPYFDGYAWSATLEYWLERRPEWFLYRPDTGDVLWSYDTSELMKHKQAETFGAAMRDIGNFAGVPDYSREDTVDYAADQVIAAYKIFKMPGLRWDMHVVVWPGYADFYGKLVAKDYKEADAISAKMLQRLKDRINKAIPGFAWGYNAGNRQDVDNYPLTCAVRCQGGGYMLDECIYDANNKSNPYHLWPAYLKYNADLQEWHRQRGGYFNPYAPSRGGCAYAVDRIYDTVLRAASGSYVQAAYYDSSLRFGNYPQFATRYSAFFYAQDRSRLSNPKQWVDVKSPREVWWEPVVYQRQRSANERQIIVNLINPPTNPGLEEPPHNEFPPPAKDLGVTLKEQDGWKVSGAWLLMGEAENEQAAPVTQHKALAVARSGTAATVTVPCLFHWKTVVFEMARTRGGK